MWSLCPLPVDGCHKGSSSFKRRLREIGWRRQHSGKAMGELLFPAGGHYRWLNNSSFLTLFVMVFKTSFSV